MGNPFVHLEYSADDAAAAKKFYAKIFDWKFKEMPGMGGWAGIDPGRGVGGGLGGKQDPREPTGWTAYAEVDDVKKTIAKAEKAGATVILPFMEIPGMGALGIFIDPQGARLGVWQTAKKQAGKKGAKEAAGDKTARKPGAKKRAK